MRYLISLALIGFGFAACENNSSTIDQTQKEEPLSVTSATEAIEEQVEADKQEIAFEDEAEFAQYVLKQFDELHFDQLANYMDNEEGVLLSPYAHINKETAPIYDSYLLEENIDDLNFWGIQDGSGDSLFYTSREFIEKYISSFDLSSDKVTIKVYNDKPISHGSELQNVQEVFPNDKYVDFYLPPSEEGYLDWKGLIVVVGKKDGKFQLKAILHNQWTI